MDRLHVVIGIIINANNECCIAKRAKHVHLGGLWEFPGGKVEPNEEANIALARELNEELGIIVQRASPFIQIPYDYVDRKVFLDFWLITEFTGEAKGREGQPVKWVPLPQLAEYEFPEANRLVIAHLLNPLARNTNG
ncbi:MAG: 8-oxo-dGTP diphosphatase MutT [Gammaproteobacteria bacterium]|nr:8-oxo-dGTP diphosphatase MutT [Gammaproteobacteria bacterium]